MVRPGIPSKEEEYGWFGTLAFPRTFDLLKHPRAITRPPCHISLNSADGQEKEEGEDQGVGIHDYPAAMYLYVNTRGHQPPRDVCKVLGIRPYEYSGLAFTAMKIRLPRSYGVWRRWRPTGKGTRTITTTALHIYSDSASTSASTGTGSVVALSPAPSSSVLPPVETVHRRSMTIVHRRVRYFEPAGSHLRRSIVYTRS